MHDFFNIIAVAILLPIEMMFHILDRSAGALASVTSGDGGIIAAIFGGMGAVVSTITEPIYDLVKWVLGLFGMHHVAEGLLMIAIGIALILLVINKIGGLLKVLMVGKAKDVLHTAIGRGPLTGIASGAVMTVMVQSSSTTTALAVPLAGSGAFSLKQISPFTVGANIGTTVTALISAFAFTGVDAQMAMHASYVHLFFNLLAAALIRADYEGTDDMAELSGWVAGDANALACMGIGNYFEADADERDLITNVAIDGELPTLEAATSGAYPLTRPLFIAVSTTAIDNNPDVAEFVDYYVEYVPSVLPYAGFYGLSDEALEGARHRWDARATGAIFDGEEFPEGAIEDALASS